MDDVKNAIKRAEVLKNRNKIDGCNTLVKHSGYRYYRNNPAMSIHEIVERILKECGVL